MFLFFDNITNARDPHNTQKQTCRPSKHQNLEVLVARSL